MGASSKWWLVKLRHSELSVGAHVDPGESGRLSSSCIFAEATQRSPADMSTWCVLRLSTHILLPQEYACLHKNRPGVLRVHLQEESSVSEGQEWAAHPSSPHRLFLRLSQRVLSRIGPSCPPGSPAHWHFMVYLPSLLLPITLLPGITSIKLLVPNFLPF